MYLVPNVPILLSHVRVVQTPSSILNEGDENESPKSQMVKNSLSMGENTATLCECYLVLTSGQHIYTKADIILVYSFLRLSASVVVMTGTIQ